jgi:tetratricopeptide (TPR) repeat protein
VWSMEEPVSLRELMDAVETNRRGYASDPGGFAEGFADSLCKLAVGLKNAGRYDEALGPAEEAVTVAQRALGPSRGRADYPLSRALMTLALVARSSGRPEVAVTAIQDSIATCRRLAAVESGALDEWFARQLGDHHRQLVSLGAAEPALAAAEEAAAIYRRLNAVNPVRYHLDHQMSLAVLAGHLNAIGRPAEALAVRREQVAGLTPQSPIEELDFTIRTYNLLKRLGCHNICDVAGLGVLDVLYHPAGARWVPNEINEKLALMDLGPLGRAATRAEAPPVPPAPEWTFGALSVLCPAEGAVALVREAVTAAYAADGVRPVDRETYEAASAEHADGFVCDLRVNDDTALGSDLVVIDPEVGAWIGVKSEHWELAPQGRHPLALRLSLQWPVLSVTATKGVAYELCLYLRGAPAQYAAHGTPAGPPPVDVPLDVQLLATQSWIGAAEPALRAVFGEPTVFANLAGIPAGGLRDLLDAALLIDYPKDCVLYLGRD